MIITAEITAGAITNSGSVTVTAAVTDGSTVVVYRGSYLLGSGTISGGTATVLIPPLATGDVIQASVTERGNQAGVPIIVAPSDTVVTGWLAADTVRVVNADGSTTDYTAAAYEAAFGQHPGSVFDPVASGLTRVPAEYSPLSQVELGFDIQVTMQPGQTTLLVVARGSETLLVGYNGGSLSANAPYTTTSAGNVTVQVQRSDSTAVLSRILSVTVLPAASASIASGTDIWGLAYRTYGTPDTTVFINSFKACETQLDSGSWQAATFYGTGYQESYYPPMAPGTHTVKARVAGDANSANYKTITVII